MKKLGKLIINPEKVIKNEELVNLRGGYGGLGTCGAKTSSGSIVCGVSKEGALFWIEGDPGGWWCCDTTSSYCSTCG